MSGANLRAALAQDMRVGAGNVLPMLLEHGADLDAPRMTFDVDVDGIPAWTPLSLRDLIVAPPSTAIGEVMIDEPVAVDVLADHDHVAGLVARYNLLAVPVVDADRKLVGIVTVDDAIDTILPANRRRRGIPAVTRSQG